MVQSILVLSTRLFSQISQAILLIIQIREQTGKIRPICQLRGVRCLLLAVCRLQGSPGFLRRQISSERSQKHNRNSFFPREEENQLNLKLKYFLSITRILISTEKKNCF